MMTKALERSETETEFENEQDKIFIEMPIPRTLSEIGFLQAEKDIREGKQGTGSTLYGIVTGMKSDMSGASEQPRILEGKDEAEDVEGDEGTSEIVKEALEEVLEVEQVWIHPKDRPTVTKEERKANQKLVKEQQVNLLSHNKDWKFMTQAVKEVNLNRLFSVRKENIRCQSTRRNERKRIRKSKNNFLSETNDLKIK